ncbi:MAG: 2-iminoacetate synthase ThiH [Desulfovibrio sp.]
MSFAQVFDTYENLDFAEILQSVTVQDVDRVLGKRPEAGELLSHEDFLTLLAPAARERLEQMAQKAHQLTVQHFGKTIQFFTPLYLSNYCTNHCVYCGFNARTGIARKHLTMDEIRQEAEAISATGMKHLLILTGEAPKIATVEYLEESMEVLREYFPSVSIEIYAMDEEQYSRMVAAGVDGLTLYQETYNREAYEQLHPAGPKKDFLFRLDAPERGCRAGMRVVNIGALLGLDDWRRDSFFTGIHAAWLQKNYPSTDISISLPRMRPHAGEFQPVSIADDSDLVQVMLAQRLFLPHCGITISTREGAAFRDNIVPLGVTKMSAGVLTTVGGHSDDAEDEESTGQFDISDTRSLDDMCAAIRSKSYQPVFKDWQPFLDNEVSDVSVE